MERVVVYVPQVLHKDIKEKLTKEGKTLSWWVRDKMEKELPQAPSLKEKPVVIEKKEATVKVPLGWCDFVSAQGFGRRCTKEAVIRLPNGSFCEEHGR